MVQGNDRFILQNFYVKELADNFMLQLTVPDVGAWWRSRQPVHVAETFGTRPPQEPTLQPWGQIVGFIHDPCGVLWHVAEAG